jgi:hypothetical protein
MSSGSRDDRLFETMRRSFWTRFAVTIGFLLAPVLGGALTSP